MSNIQVHTLTDGGQTSLDVARKIAAFVDGARETLELALYDIRLHDETADVVRDGARRRARARRSRSARLQRGRGRRASSGAAAAEDRARPDRVAAVRDRGRARLARPDAPQVRRARPRCGLERLDELDRRFVDAGGERHRRRRVDGRCDSLPGGFRAALEEAQGRGVGQSRDGSDPRRRRAGAAPGSRRSAARSSRTGSRI